MPQYPHLEAKTVLLLGSNETLAGSADAGCLVDDGGARLLCHHPPVPFLQLANAPLGFQPRIHCAHAFVRVSQRISLAPIHEPRHLLVYRSHRFQSH